jgi:putative membrane protein
MTMTFCSTLLAAAVALIPAFARADDARKSDTTASSMSTSAGQTKTDKDVTKADQTDARQQSPTAMDRGSKKLTDDKVLRKLHHANLEEVKAGQLAQQKGASKDVKDYGAMLVRDHQNADQQVKAVASKLNVDVEAMKMDADKEMKSDADHQGKREAKQHQMDQLQQLTGRDFDRAFLQMMVNGHREVIEMVKTARSSGDVKPETKALLDKLLPDLQRHEDRANEILNKLGNTASAK